MSYHWEQLKPIQTCPMCGSRSVRRVIADVKFLDGLVVKEIEQDVCDSCGEKFYDSKAARRISDGIRGKCAG